MKKMFGVLAALVMGLGMVVGITAPAHAYVEKSYTSCWSDDGGIFYPGTNVCISADVHMQEDGVGMNIVSLVAYCNPAGQFEADMQVNGHGLRIFNGGGTLAWSRSDSQSNITNNCYRSFDMSGGDGLGGSNCAQIIYDFVPRYDNRPDPNEQRVGKYFCNNE